MLLNNASQFGVSEKMKLHRSKIWLNNPSLFGFLQLLSAMNCWLKCMILDPYNQTDHPECRSRPDVGLSAITELDPGYITGSL